jgi:GT2 family glycosyltransferase
MADKKRTALMKSTPLVSIVLTYWNHAKFLHDCIGCLAQQTLRDFEILIIDNGSIDRGTEDLGQKYPELKLQIIRLPANKGFAVANNLGAKMARGTWLALLNTDAFPEPDWLEQLVQAANKYPQFSFFCSRQIQFHRADLLDGAGDDYHISGLAWRRFYNYPAETHGLQEEEVFSACAAAVLYKREDFLGVEGFDENYFSYYEDVDLSFRLRLAGGRCLYAPKAVVHHVGSASVGTTSDFAVYYGHRNLVWTFFKDMPGVLFWLYLPLHIVVNIMFLVSFLIRRRGTAILRAKRDAVYHLFPIIRARRRIQSTRKVSLSQIQQALNRDMLALYRALRRPRQKV